MNKAIKFSTQRHIAANGWWSRAEVTRLASQLPTGVALTGGSSVSLYVGVDRLAHCVGKDGLNRATPRSVAKAWRKFQRTGKGWCQPYLAH